MFISVYILWVQVLSFLEPSKMQHGSRQDNSLSSVRTYIQSDRLDIRMHSFIDLIFLRRYLLMHK